MRRLFVGLVLALFLFPLGACEAEDAGKGGSFNSGVSGAVKLSHCKMACDEVESACKEKAAENEDATTAAAADVACSVGKEFCYVKCVE